MTGKSGMWLGVLALLALMLIALATVDTSGALAQGDPTPDRPIEPFTPDLLAKFEVGPEITALESIADEAMVVSTEVEVLTVTYAGVIEPLVNAETLLSIANLEADVTVTVLEPIFVAEASASAVPFVMEIQPEGDWHFEAPGIVSPDGSITVLSVTDGGSLHLVHTNADGEAMVMPLTALGEAMPLIEASPEEIELSFVSNIVGEGRPAVFEIVEVDGAAKIVGWLAPDGSLNLVTVEANDMHWAIMTVEGATEVVHYSLEPLAYGGEANWMAFPDGGGHVPDCARRGCTGRSVHLQSRR